MFEKQLGHLQIGEPGEDFKTSAVGHHFQTRLKPTLQKRWEGGELHDQSTPSLPSQGLWMQLHWHITVVPSPYLSPLDTSYSWPPWAFRPTRYFSWTFWSALHPITGVGEHITPGVCWQRHTAQGHEKVQLHPWEQPASDTPVSFMRDNVTHNVQCMVGMQRSPSSFRLLHHMVIPTLPLCFQNSHRLRGLKSQSLQQIQKRLELLFHF